VHGFDVAVMILAAASHCNRLNGHLKKQLYLKVLKAFMPFRQWMPARYLGHSFFLCRVATSCVKTSDGGETWEVISVLRVPRHCLSPGFTHWMSNNVWAAFWPSGISTDSAIFYSSDGGATWVQQETAFCKTCGYISFVHFFSEKEGVAVGDPNGGQFEIYYTSDGGAEVGCDLRQAGAYAGISGRLR
jgi:hypothetical protein